MLLVLERVRGQEGEREMLPLLSAQEKKKTKSNSFLYSPWLLVIMISSQISDFIFLLLS